MKRIAMAMIAVLLMVTLVVTVSADNFVNSVAQVGNPELQGNPEIAQGVFLILTPYAERGTLPDNGATVDEAYQSIKSADKVASLNAGLASAAESLGVSADSLVVSDLFDLSLIYSTGGFVLDEATVSQYMPVTVSVKADLLDRFVGLLHYKNGKFELVESASAKDGVLTFTVDSLSPFAIVVSNDGTNPGGDSGDSTPDSPSPDTGDVQPWDIAIVMVVSGLLCCLLFVRRKATAE